MLLSMAATTSQKKKKKKNPWRPPRQGGQSVAAGARGDRRARAFWDLFGWETKGWIRFKAAWRKVVAESDIPTQKCADRDPSGPRPGWRRREICTCVANLDNPLMNDKQHNGIVKHLKNNYKTIESLKYRRNIRNEGKVTTSEHMKKWIKLKK